MQEPKSNWVRADFNGLFSQVLCLSHGDTSTTFDGRVVPLKPGVILTAFDEDVDDKGIRDDLIASGIVEAAPEWLSCRGSRWILRIDADGVRHESDLKSSS
jgi:hypothetical protein